MDESGEDRISKLPDSVVCHILSRLPANIAVQTSVLSKDWRYKWMSIYNIQIRESLLGKIEMKDFVNFVDKILYLTRNLRIKSFQLRCNGPIDSHHLRTWKSVLLKRDIKNLDIHAYKCKGVTLAENFYNYRSLTKLDLGLECTLFISLAKKYCFPYLKILYLGPDVQLSSDYNTGKVLLNFPVLKELELMCCIWRKVKNVEINAPSLTKLMVEGLHDNSWDNLIKIDGAKLEKFLSFGDIIESIDFTAPSVLSAVILNPGGGDPLGSQARAILKGFLSLKRLKLSSEIVEELIESNTDFPLPCFNRLKQLEFDDISISEGALLKLLQVMPSLELLSLYVYQSSFFKYEGLERFPSGISSPLKVVKLIEFQGTTSQIHLARSVLKNVENLEKLIIYVGYLPLIPKTEIKRLLSNFPNNSTCASVVVTERTYNI